MQLQALLHSMSVRRARFKFRAPIGPISYTLPAYCDEPGRRAYGIQQCSIAEYCIGLTATRQRAVWRASELLPALARDPRDHRMSSVETWKNVSVRRSGPKRLWGFAQAAYLDSPLPSVFEERLKAAQSILDELPQPVRKTGKASFSARAGRRFYVRRGLFHTGEGSDGRVVRPGRFV
jgi:hypothetical protein